MYFKIPKQKKFKKYHKLKKSNYSKNKEKIKDYCEKSNIVVAKSSTSNWLSINELEALSLMLKKIINKKKFNFSVNPDFFLTSKPSETRMGKGKGSPNKRIIYTRKNQIILKLKNLNKHEILSIVKLIQNKLRIKLYLNNKSW